MVWSRKPIILQPNEYYDYDDKDRPPPGYRWETEEEVRARMNKFICQKCGDTGLLETILANPKINSFYRIYCDCCKGRMRKHGLLDDMEDLPVASQASHYS